MVPARLKPASPEDVAAALERFRGDSADKSDLRLLAKHFLALLEARAPGKSVEVRVPPYAAIQCIDGVRHTRGTPPAVIETDAATWIELAIGALTWGDAVESGRATASGERTDLSVHLPLARPRDSLAP